MSLKHRHFDPITVQAEAGRRRVHRIKCSRCEAFADVSANTTGGSRAHDDILKIWKRGGWEIGNNSNRDFCPDCMSAKRAARRQPSKPEPTEMSPEPLNAQVIPMPEPSRLPPQPPRQPSFDERRLILAKLEETYVDEKTGYGEGWTDKRVAEDLGIPRKWVEDLRDANFGPTRDNEEIRAALDEARTLRSDAQRAISDARREAGVLRARADELDKQIVPLMERLGDVDRRLASIEKAVR